MTMCVAYDISDDRRRNRMALELLKIGIRLQKSVFLVDIKQKDLKRLIRKLRKIISDRDALMVIPLCNKCLDNTMHINSYHSEGACVI